MPLLTNQPIGAKMQWKRLKRCVMTWRMSLSRDTIQEATDLCCWIPSPTGPAGWIIYRGWAVAPATATVPTLRLEYADATGHEHTTPPLRANEDRGDITALFGIAAPSGFLKIIPCAQRPAPMTARLHHRGTSDGSDKSQNRQIQDLGDPQTLHELARGESWRLNRLRNLVCNTAESLGGVAQKSASPISLYLDPSFGCNLNCLYCVSDSIRQRGFTRRPLTLDLVDGVLDRYGDHLIRATLAMWGEPLLNTALPAIVAKFKARRIFVELSTNLALPLSPGMAQALVQSGLDEMRLSIDGASQDVYEKYRIGGTLAQVLDNVRLLAATKARLGQSTPRLNWQYLLFPWNEHEAEQARTLAAQAGADSFYTLPGRTWMWEPDTRPRCGVDETVPLPAAAQDVLTQAQAAKTRDHEAKGCDFLNNSLSLNSDGAVSPCCYMVYPKHTVGLFQDLDDPFNAPGLVAMRRFVTHLGAHTAFGPDPCATCGSLTQGHVMDHLPFPAALAQVLA